MDKYAEWANKHMQELADDIEKVGKEGSALATQTLILMGLFVGLLVASHWWPPVIWAAVPAFVLSQIWGVRLSNRRDKLLELRTEGQMLIKTLEMQISFLSADTDTKRAPGPSTRKTVKEENAKPKE